MSNANGAAGAQTKGYQPSPAVAKLLAERGVAMHPPKSKAGSHDVEWEGKKFVLPKEPAEISLRRASEVFAQKAAEEDKLIAIDEIVDALPWDGAQAFAKAVEDLFGFGLMEDRPGMFGPQPSVLRSIKTGPNPEDVMQVIWGGIGLPQLTAKDQDTVVLQCGMGVVDGDRPVFTVQGRMPRGKRHILDTLMALARIYASERSIYKGKAIRMFVDEDGDLDWDKEPEFLRLNPALTSELVFSAETAEQIEVSLFTPIRHAEAARRLGVPLKRGILLEGPYGVGKSMTAAATASVATENGWTFIMLNRVGGLQQILDFAHRYAPVVVFAEDIDRVISGHDRTVSIDDILNTLDGVQGKDREIITVLTTNHVEQINKALLRPGRLDAIVSIRAPDAAAAEKLVRQYARGLVADGASLAQSREMLAGKIPAVIREVVERSKLAAIARGADTLSDDDLMVAARSMEQQLALLAPAKIEPSLAERLGSALHETVAAGLANGPVKQVKEDTQAIRDHIGI